MAVGTPHYMSPEQALGADHADGRSDIYSLGCVLYELLAGQPPFDGPNSRAILARHAMEQVPSIRIVRQSVPEELEDAVLQALEKTPADRFQKMSELAELLADLEPTVATRRTTSRGVPTVRRTTSTKVQAGQAHHAGGDPGREVGNRGTSVVDLGGAARGADGGRLRGVADGLRTGGGGAGLRARSGPGAELDPNHIAIMYFEKAPGSPDSLEYVAHGLTEALINQLSSVQGLQVISSNGVRPYRAATRRCRMIAQEAQRRNHRAWQRGAVRRHAPGQRLAGQREYRR